MFDFSIVTQWVDTLLRSWMSPTAAVIVACVLVGVCLLLGYAVIALALIYIERKVCAFFQCRLGPNRVGPYGVIQSVADMFAATGAGSVVTACPLCKKAIARSGTLPVYDLAEIVAQALPGRQAS